MAEVRSGEGYAVAALDDLGSGYGFRKIRRSLGVTAFGINALVLPPGYSTGTHFHDAQEETYFVHQGQVEFWFGDGARHQLGPGGVARVDPQTHRGMRNVGQGDAIVVVAGGRGGYVGRDGQAVGSDSGNVPPEAADGPAGAAGGGPPGAGSGR
jgi:quercetin dioxygenase-like cupin family protein